MQARVANLFRILGSSEIEIERARHEIIEAAGNQIDKAYYFLEKNTDGEITTSNLAQFLVENGVEAEDNEILTIVDHYDLSGKDALSYEDFTRAIKPQDWNKNKFNERLNCKEQTLKLALVRFFTKELELVRKVNAQKVFIDSKYWTSFDTYRSIDPVGKGSFNYEDLDRFLQRYGVVLPHIDVRAAFRRVDKNGNGSVTFKELSEQLYDETHLQQISATCCPGSFRVKTPSKRPSSPEFRETAKQEKMTFESQSPALAKNSFASTFQSNHKSPGETGEIGETDEIFQQEPTDRATYSAQRLHSPHLYDVQTYTAPSFRQSTRPFISSNYSQGRIDSRLAGSVRVASPVRYHTAAYIRPQQRIEHYTPSNYVAETTLEKPVSAYPAPTYQRGFLTNRMFNTQLKTHFPVRNYPTYRPISYQYQSAQRPVYFMRDDAEGVYNYHAPRSYSPEYEPAERIVTDAPFGRLTTTISASPVRTRFEGSRNISPVKVQTMTRIYEPVQGSISDRFY